MRNRILIFLLCGATFCNFACSTTSQNISASEESLKSHPVATSDFVRIYWSTPDSPRVESVGNEIYIMEVTGEGLRGFGRNGLVVTIGYEEISYIEFDESKGVDLHPGKLAGKLAYIWLCSKIMCGP